MAFVLKIKLDFGLFLLKQTEYLCRSDSSKDGNFVYAEFNRLSMRISACVNGTRPVGIGCWWRIFDEVDGNI